MGQICQFWIQNDWILIKKEKRAPRAAGTRRAISEKQMNVRGLGYNGNHKPRRTDIHINPKPDGGDIYPTLARTYMGW